MERSEVVKARLADATAEQLRRVVDLAEMPDAVLLALLDSLAAPVAPVPGPQRPRGTQWSRQRGV